jgi:hypothetical protein
METQLWLPFGKFPAKENHYRYVEVEGHSDHGLDADEAANLAMKIVIHLRKAQFRKAIEIIAAAELEFVGESEFVMTYPALLESHLTDSSLPQRVLNMLGKKGFKVWGDVVYRDPNWFSESINNWGPRCTEELQLALRREITKRRKVLRDSID